MNASLKNDSEAPFTDHSVARHAREPLVFTGRLIAQTRTTHGKSSSDSRWLELAIYETAESGFVAGIVFCTKEPRETTVSTFEELDDTSLVENFFFAFEPSEYLQQAGVRLPEGNPGSLASELYREYEIAMRDLIAHLATRKEPSSDVVNRQLTNTSEA